jgi:hypothetical protein
MLVGISSIDRVWQAKHYPLFSFALEKAKKRIQRPGSRGGKWWLDKHGNIQYGERPQEASSAGILPSSSAHFTKMHKAVLKARKRLKQKRFHHGLRTDNQLADHATNRLRGNRPDIFASTPTTEYAVRGSVDTTFEGRRYYRLDIHKRDKQDKKFKQYSKWNEFGAAPKKYAAAGDYPSNSYDSLLNHFVKKNASADLTVHDPIAKKEFDKFRFALKEAAKRYSQASRVRMSKDMLPNLDEANKLSDLVENADDDGETKDWIATQISKKLIKHSQVEKTAKFFKSEHKYGELDAELEEDEDIRIDDLEEDIYDIRERISHSDSPSKKEKLKKRLEAARKELAEIKAATAQEKIKNMPLARVYRVVAGIVDEWASTSQDSSPRARALQETYRKVFRLKNAEREFGNKENVRPEVQTKTKDILRQCGGFLEAYVKEQYRMTQEFLKKKKFKYVTIYRGMDLGKSKEGRAYYNTLSGEGNVINMSLQPASSFSASLDTANEFASDSDTDSTIIIATRVPIERVISTAMTGIGCGEETEVVIMGGELPAYVVRSDEDWEDLSDKSFHKKLLERFKHK